MSYSDYMDRRRVFTLSPDYFPVNRMREVVDYLHKHDQRFSMCSCFCDSCACAC